ncbi:MAG: hypothetical protein EB145_09670 [Proteobacteria bacterium]|nr:hypothetical protein [Pseudomonadota bacterium]
MPRHIHDVIDSTEQPHSAIFVEFGTIASKVKPFIARPIGLFVPLWLTPNTAEHRRPWLIENEITTVAAFHGHRVVINSKTPSRDAAGVTADVERYLQEMGTEYIDTVLLHGIETAEEYALRDSGMEALHRMKAAGKIRAVGISTHLGTGEIMEICATDPRVEVVLTTVNIDGQMLKGTMADHLPLVKKVYDAGKGICLMKTLAQGGLTQTPATIREAIRYNLALPYAHSICVGVNAISEVDYAVEVAGEVEAGN